MICATNNHRSKISDHDHRFQFQIVSNLTSVLAYTVLDYTIFSDSSLTILIYLAQNYSLKFKTMGCAGSRPKAQGNLLSHAANPHLAEVPLNRPYPSREALESSKPPHPNLNFKRGSYLYEREELNENHSEYVLFRLAKSLHDTEPEGTGSFPPDFDQVPRPFEEGNVSGTGGVGRGSGSNCNSGSLPVWHDHIPPNLRYNNGEFYSLERNAEVPKDFGHNCAWLERGRKLKHLRIRVDWNDQGDRAGVMSGELVLLKLLTVRKNR